jgi:hypothetical protein
MFLLLWLEGSAHNTFVVVAVSAGLLQQVLFTEKAKRSAGSVVGSLVSVK